MQKALFAFILTLSLCIGSFALAQQGALRRVDLAPKLVVLEPRDRAGEFTLLNLGNEAGVIKAEIINYRQASDGTYERLDGPLNPVFDPEQIIRLSPRQFTLRPEEVQKVRFSVRKPADLPDGEYRFHIRALRLAEQGPEKLSEKGVNTKVAMNFGASIPVVVRHGAVSVEVSISGLDLVPANAEGKPELRFTINRGGNASALGKLTAMWEPAGGTPAEIGVMHHMNVFTDITARQVAMPLRFIPQGPGVIRLTFVRDYDRSNAVYAETTLQR